MFIFPDNEAPVVENLSDVAIADENPIEITLADKVKDADSNNASIIKSINKVADESIVKAEIVKGNLLLTPLKKGTTSVELAFNSNGKVTTKAFKVSVESDIITSIADETINKINVITVRGNVMITGISDAQPIEIYNAQGVLIKRAIINNGDIISDLTRGTLYIIRISNQSFKIIL